MEHAFECLAACYDGKTRGHEWRMGLVRIRPGRRHDLTGWEWPDDVCPRCGSVYFEWLSYGEDPAEIVLRIEWDTDPAVRRRWAGSLRVRKR